LASGRKWGRKHVWPTKTEKQQELLRGTNCSVSLHLQVSLPDRLLLHLLHVTRTTNALSWHTQHTHTHTHTHTHRLKQNESHGTLLTRHASYVRVICHRWKFRVTQNA
jgi:hypothetical protein